MNPNPNCREEEQAALERLIDKIVQNPEAALLKLRELVEMREAAAVSV